MMKKFNLLFLLLVIVFCGNLQAQQQPFNRTYKQTVEVDAESFIGFDVPNGNKNIYIKNKTGSLIYVGFKDDITGLLDTVNTWEVDGNIGRNFIAIATDKVWIKGTTEGDVTITCAMGNAGNNIYDSPVGYKLLPQKLIPIADETGNVFLDNSTNYFKIKTSYDNANEVWNYNVTNINPGNIPAGTRIIVEFDANVDDYGELTVFDINETGNGNLYLLTGQTELYTTTHFFAEMFLNPDGSWRFISVTTPPTIPNNITVNNITTNTVTSANGTNLNFIVPQLGFQIDGSPINDILNSVVQTNSGWIVRSFKKQINILSTGTHLLIPNGVASASSYLIPMLQSIMLDSIAGGTLSVMPTVSIGTNSPNYDNIVASTTVTGLTAKYKIAQGLTLLTSTALSSPQSAVYLKITGAASGSGVTNASVTCTVVTAKLYD